MTSKRSGGQRTAPTVVGGLIILGAYIADNTAAGDYPKIVLGIAIMSLMVTAFNRLLWRPLYAFAEDRLRLD